MAVYNWLRQPTVVSVAVFGRIRQNMAVIRHVFYCKRGPSSAVYGTVEYGRNMVPTKCVFHGPYTLVIMTFRNVYISVNDVLPLFTIIVMLDLRFRKIHYGLISIA
jgi:hypothetical protein